MQPKPWGASSAQPPSAVPTPVPTPAPPPAHLTPHEAADVIWPSVATSSLRDQLLRCAAHFLLSAPPWLEVCPPLTASSAAITVRRDHTAPLEHVAQAVSKLVGQADVHSQLVQSPLFSAFTKQGTTLITLDVPAMVSAAAQVKGCVAASAQATPSPSAQSTYRPTQAPTGPSQHLAAAAAAPASLRSTTATPAPAPPAPPAPPPPKAPSAPCTTLNASDLRAAIDARWPLGRATSVQGQLLRCAAEYLAGHKPWRRPDGTELLYTAAIQQVGEAVAKHPRRADGPSRLGALFEGSAFFTQQKCGNLSVVTLNAKALLGAARAHGQGAAAGAAGTGTGTPVEGIQQAGTAPSARPGSSSAESASARLPAPPARPMATATAGPSPTPPPASAPAVHAGLTASLLAPAASTAADRVRAAFDLLWPLCPSQMAHIVLMRHAAEFLLTAPPWLSAETSELLQLSAALPQVGIVLSKHPRRAEGPTKLSSLFEGSPFFTLRVCGKTDVVTLNGKVLLRMAKAHEQRRTQGAEGKATAEASGGGSHLSTALSSSAARPAVPTTGILVVLPNGRSDLVTAARTPDSCMLLPTTKAKLRQVRKALEALFPSATASPSQQLVCQAALYLTAAPTCLGEGRRMLSHTASLDAVGQVLGKHPARGAVEERLGALLQAVSFFKVFNVGKINMVSLKIDALLARAATAPGVDRPPQGSAAAKSDLDMPQTAAPMAAAAGPALPTARPTTSPGPPTIPAVTRDYYFTHTSVKEKLKQVKGALDNLFPPATATPSQQLACEAALYLTGLSTWFMDGLPLPHTASLDSLGQALRKHPARRSVGGKLLLLLQMFSFFKLFKHDACSMVTLDVNALLACAAVDEGGHPHPQGPGSTAGSTGAAAPHFPQQATAPAAATTSAPTSPTPTTAPVSPLGLAGWPSASGGEGGVVTRGQVEKAVDVTFPPDCATGPTKALREVAMWLLSQHRQEPYAEFEASKCCGGIAQLGTALIGSGVRSLIEGKLPDWLQAQPCFEVYVQHASDSIRLSLPWLLRAVGGSVPAAGQCQGAAGAGTGSGPGHAAAQGETTAGTGLAAAWQGALGAETTQKRAGNSSPQTLGAGPATQPAPPAATLALPASSASAPSRPAGTPVPAASSASAQSRPPGAPLPAASLATQSAAAPPHGTSAAGLSRAVEAVWPSGAAASPHDQLLRCAAKYLASVEPWQLVSPPLAYSAPLPQVGEALAKHPLRAQGPSKLGMLFQGSPYFSRGVYGKTDVVTLNVEALLQAAKARKQGGAGTAAAPARAAMGYTAALAQPAAVPPVTVKAGDQNGTGGAPGVLAAGNPARASRALDTLWPQGSALPHSEHLQRGIAEYLLTAPSYKDADGRLRPHTATFPQVGLAVSKHPARAHVTGTLAQLLAGSPYFTRSLCLKTDLLTLDLDAVVRAAAAAAGQGRGNGATGLPPAVAATALAAATTSDVPAASSQLTATAVHMQRPEPSGATVAAARGPHTASVPSHTCAPADASESAPPLDVGALDALWPPAARSPPQALLHSIAEYLLATPPWFDSFPHVPGAALLRSHTTSMDTLAQVLGQGAEGAAGTHGEWSQLVRACEFFQVYRSHGGGDELVTLDTGAASAAAAAAPVGPAASGKPAPPAATAAASTGKAAAVAAGPSLAPEKISTPATASTASASASRSAEVENALEGVWPAASTNPKQRLLRAAAEFLLTVSPWRRPDGLPPLLYTRDTAKVGAILHKHPMWGRVTGKFSDLFAGSRCFIMAKQLQGQTDLLTLDVEALLRWREVAL